MNPPPPAQMTFKDVLGLTVMRRIWWAQIASMLPLALLGPLFVGVRAVFLGCAALAWTLAAAGHWLLRRTAGTQ